MKRATALRTLGQRAACCDACGDVGPWQLDRRWPGYMGGSYVEDNVHRLCLRCHGEKSVIESAMRGGDISAHARWFDLAYPPGRTPVFALGYVNYRLSLVGAASWIPVPPGDADGLV
jgi:hypothetical protein